jgi:hypothetical protein
MLPPEIQVQPTSLVEASAELTRLGDGVTSRAGGLKGRGASAESSLDQVLAGPGWSDFVSAWSAALGRSGRAIYTHGSNTAAAAVVYEDADRRAMPRAPEIPAPAPPPEQPDCSPDILGNVPPACLEA